MKFRTAYEEIENREEYVNKYSAPSGEKIVLEHREEISKDGKRKLIKDRKVNIYDKIQASKEACEIENILRRAAEGDTSVLSMVNGQYLDVTGAPNSLAEAQQFVIRAKGEFDNLPKEIRAKFENNAEIYVATYGSNDWLEKTGIAEEFRVKEEKIKNEDIFKKNMEATFANLAEKGALTNE